MNRPLEERTVELHSGSHSAIATLLHYSAGWVVDVIAEEGEPDVTDDGVTYPTLEAARVAAEKLWRH